MSPHELSVIVHAMGAISLTWKELHADIQKHLLNAIHSTAPSMRSWDISQMILGLGMMEAPTSLLTAGSQLENLLMVNAKLFRPHYSTWISTGSFVDEKRPREARYTQQ